jgi:hypothetical protein
MAGSFTPTDFASMIAHFEGKSSPLNSPFYYEENTNTINFGFGSNLTAAENSALSNKSTLKNDYNSWLIANGISLTEAQWESLSSKTGALTKQNGLQVAASLNASLASKNWYDVAASVADSYANSIVSDELKKNIANILSLPSTAQIALENIDYDHSSLLGPIVFNAAVSENLPVLAEQLAFNADNALSVGKRPKQSGLEERFLGDGLLALGMIPTYDSANVITNVAPDLANVSDVVQFLKDILVGTNTIGGGGLSAEAYVKTWGTNAATSYKNLTSKLDAYLQKQGIYVASTDEKLGSIDTKGVAFSGDTFTLINAPYYNGAISGFVAGKIFDLADISATGGTLSSGKLAIQESDGSVIDLKVAVSIGAAASTALQTTQAVYAVPDGNGGTDIVLTEPSLIGIGYNSSTNQNFLESYNPSTGQVTPLSAFSFDTGYYSSTSFVANGTDAFAVSSDGLLYDFNVATGAIKSTFSVGDVGALASSGSVLLSIGYNSSTSQNFLESINPSTHQISILSSFAFDTGYYSASTFVANGSDAFIVSSDGLLYDFDATTGTIKTTFSVGGLDALTTNGNGLLGIGYNSSTKENFLESIDPSTRQVSILSSFTFDTGFFSADSFVANGTDAFVVSSDGLLYDFDATTGTLKSTTSVGNVEAFAIDNGGSGAPASFASSIDTSSQVVAGISQNNVALANGQIRMTFAGTTSATKWTASNLSYSNMPNRAEASSVSQMSYPVIGETTIQKHIGALGIGSHESVKSFGVFLPLYQSADVGKTFFHQTPLMGWEKVTFI